MDKDLQWRERTNIHMSWRRTRQNCRRNLILLGNYRAICRVNYQRIHQEGVRGVRGGILAQDRMIERVGNVSMQLIMGTTCSVQARLGTQFSNLVNALYATLSTSLSTLQSVLNTSCSLLASLPLAGSRRGAFQSGRFLHGLGASGRLMADMCPALSSFNQIRRRVLWNYTPGTTSERHGGDCGV
jgi:hypothetical protein